MSRNTGTYIQQSAGYKAFVPSNLPPDPPIRRDAEMDALLSKADRALGRLDGSIAALPNPDLFVFMYVRKEAALSSEIEGTQASISDLLEDEAQIFDPKRPDDVGELRNYVLAMDYGLKRLAEFPLSLRLIRDIHRELMSGVRGQHANPGEFRTSQNWIGPAGGALKDAVFVPPPHTELMSLLGNLETYIRDDRQTLLIQIGLAHAQFETLHPFLDGNGRVGRLLITFIMCEREVLSKPVLYLSHYLKRNRQQYYEMLQATRDEGRLEEWLKFFLRGVSEVANEATETARKIVEMRESHRDQLIVELGRGAANGLKLLESLYQRPIFTVATVKTLLGLTSPAANTLTNKFQKLGLVEEITGHQRNRVFRYQPYIGLFQDS